MQIYRCKCIYDVYTYTTQVWIVMSCANGAVRRMVYIYPHTLFHVCVHAQASRRVCGRKSSGLASFVKCGGGESGTRVRLSRYTLSRAENAAESSSSTGGATTP